MPEAPQIEEILDTIRGHRDFLISISDPDPLGALIHRFHNWTNETKNALLFGTHAQRQKWRTAMRKAVEIVAAEDQPVGVNGAGFQNGAKVRYTHADPPNPAAIIINRATVVSQLRGAGLGLTGGAEHDSFLEVVVDPIAW